MGHRSEKEVRKFYEQWKAPVFTFCCLFLGDEDLASEATVEGFLAYVRTDLPLQLRRLPEFLLRSVLDAVKNRCSLPGPQRLNGRDLEGAVRSLPCDQRAVFILRSVVGLPEQSVAFVTELSTEQVRRLWVQSLIGIRNLLSDLFFKERVQ